MPTTTTAMSKSPEKGTAEATSPLSVLVNDQNARTALVAFPQGVPWHVEEMTIAIQEKISSRKSNSSSSSGGSSSKRKRSVTGSLDNVQYSSGGSSDSAKNDVYKYALGVIDETNGTMEVIPVDHPYILRPQLELQATISTRESTMMSSYDRKQSLTEAFGSKKKQRAMRAVASNLIKTENISGVDAVEEAMDEVNDMNLIADGSSTVLDGANNALEAHRLQFLPPFDTSTNELKKCYPISKLIPAFLMEALDEVYTNIEASKDFSECTESSLSLDDFWNLKLTGSFNNTNDESEKPEGDLKVEKRLLSSCKLITHIMETTDINKILSRTLNKPEKYGKKARTKVILLLYLRFTMDFLGVLLNSRDMCMKKDDFIEAFKIKATNPNGEYTSSYVSFHGYLCIYHVNVLFHYLLFFESIIT